ncbi:hypothetical protein [Paenibacillus ginsengarvi]|uniref:Uncharacterized protein n=1 Tax=Paenibacillus ginsengarvi TaxID=400777 RepID=A0A3B0BY93_9BACL|nr:hypothetical protein [Paenibacillus ginsengarvi]RKN77149.1 hypothetical protein D7M11_24320 [Paenibacillus ginsengarvi]
MSAKEERTLFGKIDGMHEHEAMKRLAEIEPPNDEQPSAAERAALAAIRARTFARLGLVESEVRAADGDSRETAADRTGGEPEYRPQEAEFHSADAGLPQAEHGPIQASRTRNAYGRKTIRAAIAAALLAVALTSLYSASSSEVRAQVHKWLQFLPGFASVQQSEDNTVRLVLTVPVEESWRGGTVELRAVSIGDSYSSIGVAGSAGPDARSVVLTNADGDRYTFQYGTISRAGVWLGQYYYKGSIRATEEMEASFNNGAPSIKFRLHPAVSAEKIEDLGVTSEHDGIRMTAVLSANETNKRRVALLPELPDGLRITSYGLADFDQMEKPVLTTAAGKQIELQQDELFPNRNEFSFSQEDQDASANYRLVVPTVEAVKHTDKPVKITFPVPKEGELTLGKRIVLLGYPVELVRVERIPGSAGTGVGSVRLIWNMLYDADAAVSPLLFFPDFGYTGQSGVSAVKTDEATRAMQHMELEVAPGEKEHSIYVSDLTLLIRGPWTFDLK